MAVRMEFENAEAAPEALRPHLTEADGKFVFEAETLTEVKGLKSALEKERKEKAEREKLLAKVKDVDVEKWEKLKDLDPERVQAALDAEAHRQEEELKAQGKFKEALDQRVETLTKEYKGKESQYQKDLRERDEFLDELLIDREIASLAPGAGVKSTAMEDLLARARRFFRRDGKKVVPRDATAVNVKTGDPYTPGEWLGDLASTAPHLFGETKGSGANNHQGGGTPPQKKRSQMSLDEKTAFIAKHGSQAFQQLPA